MRQSTPASESKCLVCNVQETTFIQATARSTQSQLQIQLLLLLQELEEGDAFAVLQVPQAKSFQRRAGQEESWVMRDERSQQGRKEANETWVLRAQALQVWEGGEVQR